MDEVFSTLVVVESGAPSLGLFGHARVVTQLDGESNPSFLARVRTEIEGAALHRVILSAGASHDFARIALRSQVAQTAAAFFAASGGGSLVLAASDPRGELAQRALGEILRDQLGSTVSVAVRNVDAIAIPTAA